MINPKEYVECLDFLGYNRVGSRSVVNAHYGDSSCRVIAMRYGNDIEITYYGTLGSGRRVVNSVPNLILATERILSKYDYNIGNSVNISTSSKLYVKAAINTRNLAKDIIRVKSSNVWGYAFNIKDRRDKMGTLIVQFKAKNGGPGHIYCYYDVPTMTYRRWQSANSKGHYFWEYIRNNFKYSKLTGDKRGVLPNAVNQIDF